MQGMPLFYGVWGTVNAIFVILTTIIWYNCYAKKNGISLDSIDMRTSAAQIGKTIATALVVTGMAFCLALFSEIFSLIQISDFFIGQYVHLTQDVCWKL